jgi:xylulokinase
MENCLERDFKDVRIIGGGSNSDFVLQTTADIFGQHVNRIQTPSAEALGAAILASKGVGLYRSIDEAVKHMVRITKRFKPNSRNFEVYDDLYRHIYKKIQVFTIELYKSANANTR